MTDDELERRKEETWGMSEIRGSNPEKRIQRVALLKKVRQIR